MELQVSFWDGEPGAIGNKVKYLGQTNVPIASLDDIEQGIQDAMDELGIMEIEINYITMRVSRLGWK